MNALENTEETTEQQSPPEASTPGNTASAAPTPDPAPAPPDDGIQAFDRHGRAVTVPREEWRTQVLPGMLQHAWDDPEQLYYVIGNSLQQGFIAEMEAAAAHLAAIDPIPARGACIQGVVLMNTGRIDQAEALLSGFEAIHPPDASVLVNLAQIYASRHEMERTRATLDRALTLEPNHEQALLWSINLQLEPTQQPEQMQQPAQTPAPDNGHAARALLERVAAHPQSWRAQLWLARGALNAGDLAHAQHLYREALLRTPRPVPVDFMLQMSGDLGLRHHPQVLCELTGPHFVPGFHGLAVGNNLIKALLELGQLDQAEQVTAALVALNQAAWKDPLEAWNVEIARLRLAKPALHQEAIPPSAIGAVRIEGAIWLPPNSPSSHLFPRKDPAAPRVAFLGASAESPDPTAAPDADDANAPEALRDVFGHLTRSLPLFLAEQVQMRTAAAGRTLLPWEVSDHSGFAVALTPLSDENALDLMRSTGNDCEYLVNLHLDAEIVPWTATLAFLRVSDAARIGELEAEFDPLNPVEGLSRLAEEVVELLSVLGPSPTPSTSLYAVPSQAGFLSYLLRLDDLILVRAAGADGMSPAMLHGESQMLDAQLALCQAEPDSLPARLIHAETVAALEALTALPSKQNPGAP